MNKPYDFSNGKRGPVLPSRDKTPITTHIEAFEATQRRMKPLAGIAYGEHAVTEGRVLTHQQAKDRLSRWLK